MIAGYFDERGRPYVRGLVRIPRLNVVGRVNFLVDTGASVTSLSPNDGDNLLVPVSELINPATQHGIAGTRTYYREPAVILFSDGTEWRRFDVELYIAPADTATRYLPSLLGAGRVECGADGVRFPGRTTGVPLDRQQRGRMFIVVEITPLRRRNHRGGCTH